MSITSTMLSHLAMVHEINGTLEVESKTSKTSEYVQPKIEAFVSSKRSYPTQSPHHIECTISIPEHSVQDMRPFGVVSSPAFRKMVENTRSHLNVYKVFYFGKNYVTVN